MLPLTANECQGWVEIPEGEVWEITVRRQAGDIVYKQLFAGNGAIAQHPVSRLPSGNLLCQGYEVIGPCEITWARVSTESGEDTGEVGDDR